MMERLTKRDFVFNSHYVANKLQSWSIAQCLKKLQEYENAEEDGRLLVLPCKEGTKVYRIGYRLSGNHEIEERYFSLTYFRPSDFGKTIFLTREEAERVVEGNK